jgi:phage gp36-like protein
MAYCTLEDLLNEIDRAVLVELTDDPEDPTGDIIEANIDSAIAKADAVIDGYVGCRVSVPIEYPTNTIREISKDISLFVIFTRKETLPEQRKTRYEAAMKFLNTFSYGEGSLGAVIGDAPAESLNKVIYSAPTQDMPAEAWDEYY